MKIVHSENACATGLAYIEIQYQIHTREMSFIHDSCLDFGADRSLNIYLAYVKNQILGT